MLALCGFEAARLFLGQEDNLHKKISVVFRILVLTVPAQYLTFSFPSEVHSLTSLRELVTVSSLSTQHSPVSGSV